MGFENVLGRDIFELRAVFPDIVAVAIPFLSEGNGTVAAVELREERGAAEPLPVAGVAGGFVVDEEFFEDFGAALPGDVRSASREEAGDGVAGEVVDPPFLSQLSHDGVNPRKACLTVAPALKPDFCFLAIDFVGAGGEFGADVDFAGEVPGDEAAVAVVVGLSETPAQGGLGGEVHVSEEELTCQALWWC